MKRLGQTVILLLAGALSLKAQVNLLVNGDFEAGNQGFTTGYNFNNGRLSPEGAYAVLADPHDGHPGGSSMHDHTSGSGLMLAANGGKDPTNAVWSETVPVRPNTFYLFSGWAASWGQLGNRTDPSPALLVVDINGVQLGAQVRVAAQNGKWQNFTVPWNSEGSTQAVIQIMDQNTEALGNDFALDDLFFAPMNDGAFVKGGALIAPTANSGSGVNNKSMATGLVVPSTTAPSPTIYNSVEINWVSTPNVTYQVQWSPALTGTNWNDLVEPVTATGATTSAWDRVAPGSRFYRVVVFQ